MPATKPVGFLEPAPKRTPILVLPAEFSCSLTLPDDARRRSTVPEYDSLANVYDLEYAHDYDLPFWLSLAEREAGPVVEWDAGTGRLAVPLTAAGHDVTAVEVSAKMVERGKVKSERVGWIVGDMRSVDPGRRYGLAVCAFNSFVCLRSVDDALAFLRNAHEHLVPGGLLGIEVSALSPEELVDPPGGTSQRHDFTRELANGRLDRYSVSHYDADRKSTRLNSSH